MTIVEFLTARVAEDAAEIAKQPDAEGEFEGVGLWASGDVLSNTSYLIVNKSRALREVEAQRRRIELHGAEPGQHPDFCGHDLHELPCPTLRLEALPYADHLAYQEKWRP